MNKYILALILLSLFASWPLFKNGFFKTDDGEWMIIRFSAFHQTLTSGQIPPRYLARLNNNYGYPVANFLYPLPFYLAELPKITGFNFQNSIKIEFIFSFIASAILMYWALRQKFTELSSFTGAAVYLFAPYRFIDVYVRGSLGEALAFVFLPLILGCIFKINKSNEKFLPLMSIFISLLVLSHNVIAMIFLPIFISLNYLINKKVFFKTLVFSILGVFISSFFWIPALYDLQYVRLSHIKVSQITEYLVPIQKILVLNFSSVESGVGLISLIILLLAAYRLAKDKIKDKLIIYLFLLSVVFIFLITSYSSLFWTRIPSVDIIQFPWRLLSVVVFSISLLTAFIINKSKNALLAVAFILSSLLNTFPYTLHLKFNNYPDSYYATNEDTTTVKDEYLPHLVSHNLARPQKRIESYQPFTILNEIENGVRYKATLEIPEDAKVTVNYLYFPGFFVKIDNQKVKTLTSDVGLINFSLPKGKHEVIISYGHSPLHLFSELLSLLAFLLAVGFFIKYAKH